MNLIKFDVSLPNGDVRHVMAESERDCIEWFESHMLKPTSVVVQSNPSRWDTYWEIPLAVGEVVIHRPSMLQDEAKRYEQFGRVVHRILQEDPNWGSDALRQIWSASNDYDVGLPDVLGYGTHPCGRCGHPNCGHCA